MEKLEEYIHKNNDGSLYIKHYCYQEKQKKLLSLAISKISEYIEDGTIDKNNPTSITFWFTIDEIIKNFNVHKERLNEFMYELTKNLMEIKLVYDDNECIRILVPFSNPNWEEQDFSFTTSKELFEILIDCS